MLIHGNDIMRMVLWSMVANECEMDSNECTSIAQLYLGTLRDHIFNTFCKTTSGDYFYFDYNFQETKFIVKYVIQTQ